LLVAEQTRSPAHVGNTRQRSPGKFAPEYRHRYPDTRLELRWEHL